MNIRQDSREKSDLFTDMQEKTGCHFISDLRWHQEKVKELLREIPKDKYTEEQIQEFKSYVFEK